MISPQYPDRREHRVLSNLVASGSKVASYHRSCLSCIEISRGSIKSEETSIPADVFPRVPCVRFCLTH
jgi:hypothetical protein